MMQNHAVQAVPRFAWFMRRIPDASRPSRLWKRTGSRRRSAAPMQRADPRPHVMAFTLVEVVIVVMIVAIVAAVGMPAVGDSFDQMKLRAAAKTLMADLNYVRNLAIADGREHGLVFSSTGYTAFLETPPAGEEEARVDVIEHPISHRPWKVSLSERSIALSADFDGGGSVTFDSSGTPGAAGSVVLRTGGGGIVVNVEAGTGRVSAQQGNEG